MINTKVIFVEGADYSGKTTFIKKITDKLSKEGQTFLILKEPFGIYRDILLDPKGELTFLNRRMLFAAGHIEIMNKIVETVKYENFDYIFIDRTSIISDWVYSIAENPNQAKTLEKVLNTIEYADKNFYESFFKNNSSIILLDIQRNVIANRIESRKIDSNDINDIKSSEFKMKIYDTYHYLIETFGTSDFSRFFNEYMILDSEEKADDLARGGIENAIFIPFNKEK